jgi:hypothetical protein
MFCPQCGLRQSSNEARFCSGCGFQLYVVSELLKTGGQLARTPAPPGQMSRRSRGLRQGAMLMLSSLVIVPVVAILGVALLGLPGELVGVVAVLSFMGGFLRMMYALMFESAEVAEPQGLASQGYAQQQQYVPPSMPPGYLDAPHAASSLPPYRGAPVPTYRTPPRFDTGEIAPPPASVTDHTTRLLERQPDEPANE